MAELREQKSSSGNDLLTRMDDQQVTPLHWKVMFISGMGFFTDAYDLFIIGVVMDILKNEWHPSKLQISLVTSTALLASALGALLFGRIADMLGRKRIYGVECLVLSAGAVASAFSPNILWLIILRFILGIGIGGDYPVSATIMSEYAGKCSRGMLVALVFAMQAAGLIVGPLIAAGLLLTHLSHDIVWRILLAVGALPPLLVFYWRRQIHETPRFLMAQGRHSELEGAAQTMFQAGGNSSRNTSSQPREGAAEAAPQGSFWDGFNLLLKNPLWFKYLMGASLTWFLMDFAYYGNTVSSPAILNAISPHASLLRHTLTQLIIFACATAPGYFVAAWAMDRIGRKLIQNLGFAMMALSFAGMALIPGIDSKIKIFLALYAISYFFTEFGPNATTFIYPAELFPVKGRTTGHGIASAAGKLGGFVGVFLFPFFMHWRGLFAAELAAAAVSVLGLLCTWFMLPETKGKSLEEVTGENTEQFQETIKSAA
jgi:MFS transporter, PHS family, inorganic phosphate transporter